MRKFKIVKQKLVRGTYYYNIGDILIVGKGNVTNQCGRRFFTNDCNKGEEYMMEMLNSRYELEEIIEPIEKGAEMRKFKCIKNKIEDSYASAKVGEIAILENDKWLCIDNKKVCMVDRAISKEYFKEIIEPLVPHVKVMLVGFEEGDVFTTDANNDKFKVVDGYILYWNNRYNEWRDISDNTLALILKGVRKIELIKNPTEKEKLEQQMRDMAVKHKKEMDELADKIGEMK